MMKKGSRVLMMDSEEARARFKHQALLQDYDEMLMEIEAKKRKLQKTIAKRLKLTTEVKFIRRKYKAFAKNPSQETPCRGKKLSRKKPSPSVQLSRPPKSIDNDLPLQVPLQDRSQRVKEVGTPSSSALFDLNKVTFSNAEHMEGIQVEWEPHKVDKWKSTHELNLSIFKDVGSSSLVGKRQISWQAEIISPTSRWYRVHLLVIDHTCTTSFVLFDREAKQFIHKSIVELRE
ncbi:uncharacterized protein LOC109835061 [Asparagus officinalis]|uniref:uncharacterized protein LOC109835061 n=1 Tax=Asparagus officinalis TaxID=4686 RepID=UPI00098E0B5E|nr:uncharacterized protein LOC109835061 [Asparagus officinalis]